MKCPACDDPKAYIGFVKVECPNSECRNFCESMVPKADPMSEAFISLQKSIDAYYSDMFKGISAWTPTLTPPPRKYIITPPDFLDPGKVDP